MPPPLAPINNSSLDMHKISTVSSASSNKSRDSSLNKSEPVGVVPKTKPKHPLQSKNSFRADPPPVPKQVLVSDPIAMPKPIVQARSSTAGKSPQAAASSQPQQPSAAVTSASPTRSSSISSPPPPTENNLTTGGTVRH